MAMTLSELRALAGLDQSSMSRQYDIQLTESMLNPGHMINETYYGKKPIKEIEEIMCRIEKKIRLNERVIIHNEPENKQLVDAVIKTFGFDHVQIYWSRDPGVTPFTVPTKRVMTKNNRSMAYGSFTKRVYDADHTMSVFVEMSNMLVTECHMTGPEMTAVLLHELGHNFDFTPYALIWEWTSIFIIILDFIVTYGLTMLYVSSAAGIVSTVVDTRQLQIILTNLDETIATAIPPLNALIYNIRAGTEIVRKAIELIFAPIGLALSVPRFILFTPIRYSFNFFLRKSETYADSMAALYGYGPEQASALDKLTAGMTTYTNAPSGMFKIFNNMMLAYQEIGMLTLGGHGSNQQRARRMLDALRREAMSSDLDPVNKKNVMAEVARMEEAYEKITRLDDDENRMLTRLVRGLVKQWYDGTAPRLMNIVDPEHTYVK